MGLVSIPSTTQPRAPIHSAAAARDPGMLAAAHIQRRVLRTGLAALLDLALARIDEAGKDQRLRLRSTLDEAAVDEQLVDTGLGHPSRLVGADEAGKDGETQLPGRQMQLLHLLMSIFAVENRRICSR